MRKCLLLLMISALMGLLAGCAHDNLKAPCPNFGARCSKTPVNSWNDNP